MATETAPEATKSTEQVFRYTAFVHVGEGAEDCTHGTDGKCKDGTHFHAVARLPNQFQHQDIQVKANAAKARRVRQLKDPETDSNAILEGELDELHALMATEPEETKATLVDELLSKDWWKRQLEANKDLAERDEYEHIEADRERLAELEAMEPEARPAEERDELLRHLEAYGTAVIERRKEIEEPLRTALEALDVNEMLDRVRDERISALGQQAFMDTYTRWQMYVGTLRPVSGGRPHERVYPDISAMESDDPEVVNALRMTFANLEAGIAAGNA